MTQRTILFLGGSMSGVRLPVDDVPRGLDPFDIVVDSPRPVFQRPDGSIPPDLGEMLYRRERYVRVTFGAVRADFMMLSNLQPEEALGQYLRGEVIR